MTAPHLASVPDAPVTEPTNLRELYAQARRDLDKPDARALLRWVFWHAKAVGRLEATRIAHGKVTQQERDVRLVMNTTLSDAVRAVLEQQLPAPSTIIKADDMLVEAAAYVDATASVVEMLAR